MLLSYVFHLYFIFPLVLSFSTDPNRPNIIFFFGDDWGYNDVGYNGGNDAITPNLNRLANNGLILNKYYTQGQCTPARSAFLTGKYPINTGMQHFVLTSYDVYGLPLNFKLLPEILKEIGNYETHMVGKWHLGFVSNAYLPTNRGFDTFVGFYNGEETYHTKVYTEGDNSFSGMDFRYQNEAYNNTNYSTDIFTHNIKEILYNSINSKNNDPFFIYGAYQNVHRPNELPYDKDYKNMEIFSKINNDARKIKLIQAYIFDEQFGEIVSIVKKNEELWDNTLIIFASDNGGDTLTGSSNFPLRGKKGTNYEGGHRVPAFINGGYMNKNNLGQKHNRLFHVTDWYPTILSLITKNKKNKKRKKLMKSLNFDGVDQSNLIVSDLKGKINSKVNRNEILLNLDPYFCNHKYCGAIIYKNWKLIMGRYVIYSDEDWAGWPDIDKSDNKPLLECKNENNITFNSLVSSNACPWNGKGCLYDLINDPCEYNDLSDENPKIYNKLLKKLKKYTANMAQPLQDKYSQLYTFNIISKSNPKHFNGFWTPWMSNEENEKLLKSVNYPISWSKYLTYNWKQSVI